MSQGLRYRAQFIVPREHFRRTSGETATTSWSRPDGWGVVRCRTCGSPLPASIDGVRVWVPAGLMDDPLETSMRLHIFCASRADWDAEAADARHFDEYPT